MIIIKRNMSAEKSSFGEDAGGCQASFNSDGRLTLRKYVPGLENADVITIFDAKETESIIRLFCRINNIKGIKPDDDLPF